MAQGDLIFFEQYYNDVQLGLHDLENDTLNYALVDNSTSLAANTPDPRWSAGGSTNLSSDQVTPGGNYADGGAALSTPTVTLTTGDGIFDAGDVSIAQDGSNPSNAYYLVVYNDTDAGKRAIFFVDLGGPVDLSAGPFAVNFNASGISNLGAA